MSNKISPYHFKTHKHSQHEGIKYPCNNCTFKASCESNLKAHKDRKYRGIEIKCEYRTNTSINLKRHKLIKHEGLRYL